jgi:hypothetical protein
LKAKGLVYTWVNRVIDVLDEIYTEFRGFVSGFERNSEQFVVTIIERPEDREALTINNM